MYICVCSYVYLYISNEQLVTGGEVTGAEQVSTRHLSGIK